MATIFDYPVTTQFGKVAGYPLNNGFHTGIDYGSPVGTPVVVNGVQIALSGNTGASTGPHCHVGHWNGGIVLNPGVGGGKTVNGGKITEIGYDATNGNFVRVGDADGTSWVYLHLSKVTCTKGQVLKEGVTMVDSDAITYAFWLAFRRPARKEEIDRYNGKVTAATLNLELLKSNERKDLEAKWDSPPSGFKPLGKEVYIKE